MPTETEVIVEVPLATPTMQVEPDSWMGLVKQARSLADWGPVCQWVLV